MLWNLAMADPSSRTLAIFTSPACLQKRIQQCYELFAELSASPEETFGKIQIPLDLHIFVPVPALWRSIPPCTLTRWCSSLTCLAPRQHCGGVYHPVRWPGGAVHWPVWHHASIVEEYTTLYADQVVQFTDLSGTTPALWRSIPPWTQTRCRSSWGPSPRRHSRVSSISKKI